MVDNLIRLYNYDETSFSTNGLGTLADATECKVTEELNGSYELAMKYPIDGARYSDIELGMLIYAKPNRYADFEPFRIYSISRPLNGIVTINAQHISYDLSGYIMPRWDNSKVPFATGPRSAFTRIDTEIKKVYPDFPFTFYTDSDEDHPAPDSDMYYELTCNVPKSVRALLGDGDGNMLSIYTGDYLFEKFNVSFLTERGENKGVTIKYGKNMTELTANEDNSTLYSAVYPYWTDQERYVELPEKVIRVRDDIPDNTLLLDLSSDFAKCPADEDIREFVERYINDNNIGLPFSTVDVSFEQLSKSSEYSQYAMLEQVELGDYITVEYDLLLNGPQTVRCTKVVYDVLLDKAETIELGTSRNLVNSLAQQQSTLSNSTQYTDQYVQEAVKNISYDSALSTTSENAVQNKVVTGAFNNANDAITFLKNQYSTLSREIQELIESGSKVTFGTTTPENSMGDDGEIYVKIKSTAGGGYAIVAVYYKYEGVWLANSNKEVLTGTLPPTQSTGDNDNVYIDFKYSSLEDYKLTKVWDCGGGWYGGFDLTVNKTAADQPTAFLFDGSYQQSVAGCNEWYIELSDLTPGDVITISFDYQMVQQNPNFDITPYIATDKWYQHGICVLGIEDARDSRIWSNENKVKYGWSETSGFLSVHQDWNLHSYEFDYTVESSKVYIYFNWQGWTRDWAPSSIYDPPRKVSINITNFVISQKVKTIVGIDNVYYKYEGKWWQDDAQQYKGDFIKDITSNISTGTVIANAINKNDVSIPIRVPYGVQSISPIQVIGHQTPIATITDDDGTTQTLYAPAGGGGGGGSAIGLTLLYDVGTFPDPTSGTDNVDRDLTLTDNINNYDAVYIIATPYVDHTGADRIQGTYITMTILKSDYYPPCGETFSSANRWVFMLNGSWGGNNRRVVFRFSDDGTKILAQDRRNESNIEPMIYRVYGLTFGSGGSSLPSGGTTGQALVKQSGTDYDADWDDIIQVPAGGTTGQVLGKISGTDYDIGWINQSGGGGGSGLEQTLLYSAQSASNPNTITLSESWENFDAIYLIVESNNFLMEALYLKEDLVSGYRIGATSDNGFCWYNITNDPTSLTKQSATSDHFMKTIRGIKFGSDGSGSDDYSTTETRIGTWIDGKPLYRKVATLTLDHTGTYSGTYLHNWAHGIQNVDTCVSTTGYVDDNGDHIMFGFYVTYNVFISVIFNTTNVNFRYSSDLDGKTCTFVLEYTKTTD